MADADDVIHIAQGEFQQLIRQDTRSIREPKKRMIRKDRSQPHSPGMQYSLMTQTAQTSMPMHNLNLLSKYDIPKDREEGKDSRESSFPVDDKERHMIDLEAVGQISNTRSPFIRVGDDDDFVATVDELGGELVDVAFNTAGLGEEEVADHGDVVRHFRIFEGPGSRKFWIRERIDTL